MALSKDSSELARSQVLSLPGITRITFAGLLSLAVIAGVTAMKPAAFAQGIVVGEFEIDGNTPDDTPLANPPFDWANAAANGFGVTSFTDPPSGSDTSFAQGSKEHEPDNWVFENPPLSGHDPGKSDIRTGAVAFHVVNTTNGPQQFVYVNFTVAAGQGSVHIDYEFNQSSDTVTNSQGTVIPKRTQGDIVISFDQGGGNQLIPGVFQWNGDEFVGTFSDITPSFGPNDFGSALSADTLFGEAALNFSLIPGLAQGLCGANAFNKVWAKTRSSEQITAVLKDRTLQSDVVVCDDQDPCTTDQCDPNAAGFCTSTPINCDDGLFCNGVDTCSGGTCVHPGDPCGSGTECANACNDTTDSCNDPSGTPCADDGNVCTTNQCDGLGACVAVNNTSPCDDGLFCDGTDTCSNGTCGHSGDPCAGGAECADACNEAADNCFDPSGIICADDGNVCTTNQCNGAGACVANANTLPCSDGLFCNGTDTCAGGTCSSHTGDPCAGGTQCADACNETADDCFDPSGVTCTDDGNVCTTNQCNGAGACVANANTLPCDDGFFCNGTDTCAGGTCSSHSGDPCAGGVECANTCNDEDDSCNTPFGTTCTDDGEVCTTNECNGAGACVANPNTLSCDDGLFCNGTDTCAEGTCSSHSGDPCAGGAECANTCNDANDSCNTASGTTCTDDGNVCTTNQCNGQGACVANANTLPCDDGFFCNGTDTCADSVCGHSGDPCAGGAECANTCNDDTDSCNTPVGTSCTDDGEVCTTNQCNGQGACVANPNTLSCDDRLFCNGTDTCSSGTCSTHSGDPCVGGVECADACNEAADNCFDPSGVTCTDDGNVCTTNQCNGAGACVANANTLPCNDGSFCNGTDTCSGGTCSGHSGDPCAGGAECANTCNDTNDSCNTPSGTTCTDDGNVCTDDLCDGSGLCGHPSNTGSCNDDVFCNGTDTCVDGACTHSGDPCGDPFECTVDTCSEENIPHCANTPEDTICNDNNECTADRCVGAGGDPQTGCRNIGQNVGDTNARAFGISVDLGGSPAIAPTPDSDKKSPDDLLAVPVPGVVDVRVLHVEESESSDADGADGSAEASTAQVRLIQQELGSLVSADAVQAVVTCHADETTAACSSDGSTLTNVKVNGQQLGDVNEPVDLKIDLPGLLVAHVQLLEKIGRGANAGVPQPADNTFSSGLTINAIHVTVTLGETIVTEVIVAHAEADVSFGNANTCEPVPLVSGRAYIIGRERPLEERDYITESQVGEVNLPATGGSEDATVADLGPVGDGSNNLVLSRTASSHTEGTTDNAANTASSKSYAFIEELAVLDTGGSPTNPLIGATLVRSDCESSASPGGASSSGSTTLVGLTIGGQDVCAALGLESTCKPAPNTVITVPLLADTTITLNEQIPDPPGSGSSGITVNAIHIVILDPMNPFGLWNVGAELAVSHSHCDASTAPSN